MLDKLRSEPALGGALLSLLGAALGVFLKNPALVASLVGVAGVFLGVRQVVTPVATAATQISQAATQAATQTVSALGQDTVGIVGEVTQPAKDIITTTVADVTGVLSGAK
jgi:hypothetical protein